MSITRRSNVQWRYMLLIVSLMKGSGLTFCVKEISNIGWSYEWWYNDLPWKHHRFKSCFGVIIFLLVVFNVWQVNPFERYWKNLVFPRWNLRRNRLLHTIFLGQEKVENEIIKHRHSCSFITETKFIFILYLGRINKMPVLFQNEIQSMS